MVPAITPAQYYGMLQQHSNILKNIKLYENATFGWHFFCLKKSEDSGNIAFHFARVAELVDALDLGSSGATRESSSLSFRTMFRVFPKNLYIVADEAEGLI